jgi:hypothetical protein
MMVERRIDGDNRCACVARQMIGDRLLLGAGIFLHAVACMHSGVANEAG